MINYFFSNIYNLQRRYKFFLIFIVDLLLVLFSSYFSLVIRLDKFNLYEVTDQSYLISNNYFFLAIFTYYCVAIIFKFYKISFRHYNLGSDTYYGFLIYSLSLIFLNFLFNEYFSYGAIIINCILLCGLIIFSRKLISQFYNLFKSSSKQNSIIVSSSKKLHHIYEYLKLHENIKIKAIFVDDFNEIDFSKYRNFKINNISKINNVLKISDIKNIYADKLYNVLKKNKFSKKQIHILDSENKFKLMPSSIKDEFINQYFKSEKKINRKPIEFYKNKIILITGAGGSIGKNLFFELLDYHPKKIILIDQDELKLFNLKKQFEFISLKKIIKFEIIFKLGNLSDDFFLKSIFLENTKIDYILHAAAYKHVGFGEENIYSFVKNNIFATYNLAVLAISKKVKKFIFISTDKAVNPKSIMGYSKNICEKILLFLNKKNNLNNVFKIVRFGNVINSDGSVLPIFEKQILSGGPITVTHKEVTRYFMSISNASQLVLHTITLNKSVGIFILNMGKPYKILDVAKSMIDFYLKKKVIKLKPKIIFIGLQEGEKIYEELILGKNLVKTKLKNILTANEQIKFLKNYSLLILKLKKLYKKNDEKQIKILLKKYV